MEMRGLPSLSERLPRFRLRRQLQNECFESRISNLAVHYQARARSYLVIINPPKVSRVLNKAKKPNWGLYLKEISQTAQLKYGLISDRPPGQQILADCVALCDKDLPNN